MNPLATGESDGFSGNVSQVFLGVNSKYTYNGTVKNKVPATWTFLTKYIKDYNWPVLISFGSEVQFSYAWHAVVAFGYTIMNCQKGSNNYSFKYVKVTDGWGENATAYVNWSLMVDYGLDDIISMFTVCSYQV